MEKKNRKPDQRILRGVSAEVLVGAIHSMLAQGEINPDSLKMRLHDTAFTVNKVGEPNIPVEEWHNRVARAEQIAERVEVRVQRGVTR